jgi:hypothetical protein
MSAVDFIGIIDYTHRFLVADPNARFADLRKEARKRLVDVLENLSAEPADDDEEWTIENDEEKLYLVVNLKVNLLPREKQFRKFNAVQNKDLIRLLAETYGITDRGMSRYFGCNRSTIVNLRHREGIKSGRVKKGMAPVVGHW